MCMYICISMYVEDSFQMAQVKKEEPCLPVQQIHMWV